MKKFNLVITLLLAFYLLPAQNVSLNLLTQNSGIVNVGGNVFLQIDIANTDGATAVPNYKLRPQISVPSSIVSIPTSGHQLPSGWAITFNSGSVIRLSNGTDQVPPNTTRTILIAIQGNVVGGPLTVSGNLLFSNGVAPGSSSGVALPGDNTADNTSTSTVEVTNTVPVTLTEISASVINCTPIVSWKTSMEINSSRFEIERLNQNNSTWAKVGTVIAKGNSQAENKYSFTDNTVNADAGRILYRLKIIDRNGDFKYSETRSVLLLCNSIITVGPNPVKNVVYVKATNDFANGNAVLFSVSGQLILKKQLSAGINNIDVSAVANGEYILQITSNHNIIKNVSLLIQK